MNVVSPITNFNGLIWTGIESADSSKEGKTCKVHGNAVLPKDFKLPLGSTLEIAAGTSLTIPGPDKWKYSGKITGKGTIINANYLDPEGMEGWLGLSGMKLTVLLNEKDFIKTSCVFTGNNLIDEAVRYNPKRDDDGGGTDKYIYDVVKPESWDLHVYYGDEECLDDLGNPVMINAGTYNVQYQDSDNKNKVMVSIEVTIKQRPLTDCKIGEIESQMYTGKSLTPKIEIVYEPTSYTLKPNLDYIIECGVAGQLIEANTYSAKITGLQNFTNTKEEGGVVEKKFTIEKASLEKLNTIISLDRKSVV